MDPATKQQLCDQSIAARQHAYSPYSGFQVGSAVLTESGQIYTGANIENASYGLTICAERVAAVSAVADGHRRLKAVAVASPGGHAPCGACRQFLVEFADDMLVLLVDSNDPAKISLEKLDKLLPLCFRSSGHE